jgi:hypothetical protein
LTLGYSRKAVRLLTFQSSSRIWAELHEKAFRRLGGTPRVMVLDNLKEGVLTPDFYEPRLNPLYRDVLAHYGVVPLPCRIQDPDRCPTQSRSPKTQIGDDETYDRQYCVKRLLSFHFGEPLTDRRGIRWWSLEHEKSEAALPRSQPRLLWIDPRMYTGHSTAHCAAWKLHKGGLPWLEDAGQDSD